MLLSVVDGTNLRASDRMEFILSTYSERFKMTTPLPLSGFEKMMVLSVLIACNAMSPSFNSITDDGRSACQNACFFIVFKGYFIFNQDYYSVPCF